MGKQRNRRIFAGLYKRYDGKYIYVIAVAKDAETNEAMVIFNYVTYTGPKEYLTMTKKSFCEMVEVNGKYVDKFSRQTQMRISAGEIELLREDGFDGPVRKKAAKVPPNEYDNRLYRRAYTYEEYAKDICNHYLLDVRKYNLCIEQKQYIGVESKEEFAALKEDLTFIKSCFRTVLKEYSDYFKERYVEGKSIRKYAADHNLNRGSVEYIQRKFMSTLVQALKQRDEADKQCRLNHQR